MSYIVINELFVDQSDLDAFERNFAESMTGTLTGVDGLLKARLLAPQTHDHGHLSVLEFVDQTAYERYLDSEAFATAHSWPNHAPFRSNRLSEYVQILEL